MQLLKISLASPEVQQHETNQATNKATLEVNPAFSCSSLRLTSQHCRQFLTALPCSLMCSSELHSE